jgi:DNA-directed RNA polymerase subunit delta
MAVADKKKSAFNKVLERTKKIRTDAEAAGQKYEKVDWFIPPKGDASIRVLPGIKDPDEFYKQVSTHFMPIKKKDGSMTKIPTRCLRDFEEDCPICVAFAKMVKSQDAKTREEANWLRPSTKFLVNIVNYQDRKVQPFAMALPVFNSITGWMEEFGTPIYDIEEGRDFKLIKKVKAGKTDYEVRPSMKDTAIPDKLMPLIEGASDLENLYKENNRVKMEEYVSTLIDMDEEDEDEEERSAAARSKAKAAVSKVKPKAKVEEEEDDVDADDEIEDEDEEEVPKSKFATKSKPKAKDEEDEDEEDEDEDEIDEDEEEEEKPVAKKKSSAKPTAVKSKAKSDDDDLGVDLDDDDLDKEFENLDV